MSVIAREILLAGTALSLVVSVGVSTVSAQSPPASSPELIVRVADGASASFTNRLESPTAKHGPDSLLAGVQSSHSVFAPPSIQAKTQGQGGGTSSISAFTLVLRDSTVLASVRNRLRQRSEVQYVHPNVTYSLDSRAGGGRRPPDPDSILGPNNAFADSLDHLSVIRALEGWNETAGDESVTVGIVDTGIYFDHPDLAGQFWSNPGEDSNGRDDDGNGYVDDVHGYDFVDRPGVVAQGEYDDRDPDPSPDSLGFYAGHGTAVAGVVAAQAADPEAGVVGVAPETKLVALRAIGGDGIGQTDDIAAAIMYGAKQGIDVLNLSFGRDRSTPLLRDAIQFAVSQGTVVVASAGNTGAVDEPHYPSDYPPVLSVLWLAEDGDGVPNFSRSQYGIGVDLGAPGSNVFTTQYPRGRLLDGLPVRQEDLYGSSSGSSFSAPQVAGAAALLRSMDSSLSPAAVRSILTGTASDIDGASWDHTTGAGRVDVARGLLQSYPAQTKLHFPAHNQGFSGTDPVPVVGTALDPAFENYAVYYAEGTRNLDARTDPWTQIAGSAETRVHRDTLATWDVTSLDDGAYTLRLVTTRTDGRTIEDRRRVVIDSTPPEADVQFVGTGRIEDQWGVLVDVASDDTVQSRMEIQVRGERYVREGEYVSSRQGLSWIDESGLGGEASVQVTLTNRSGLETSIQQTVSVPANRANPAYFQSKETSVPGGTMLPRAPDFDEDGLPELVLNHFATRRGGISDTVRAFEWASSGFAPADTLLARLFPKDVGDTNQDGQKELLLQINGATVLLEQRGGDLLPQDLIYADTSAVTSSIEGPSLHGARLTDLGADGRGEIVGNWRTDSTRTEWRVLERDGDSFALAERLQNPTTHERPDTVRGAPNAATGDFDGDGQRDLLVGDRDGNWIVYEATGNRSMDVAWTHETDRFAADKRFAAGDVTGDGRPEFVTHNAYSPSPPGGGESEPPISYYHVWSAVGDDAYERIYRLPVAGDRSVGAITTADFDGDARDEIAIAHPPSLFVLGASETGAMRVLHQDRTRPAVRSRSMVAADFDGNGRPSLLAATTGETLRRYTVNQSGVQRPPPRWVQAVPTGPTGSRLEWRASGADSVTVYAGPPDAALDPRISTTDSSTTIADSSRLRFALRAWSDGEGSPLSPGRLVRPHDSATVTTVQYPSPTSVRLRFTEPFASAPQPDRFTLSAHGAPRTVLQSNGGSGLVLQFSDAVAGQQATLSWTGLSDASGLQVAQTEVGIAFPASSDRSLFVEDFSVLGEQQVRLTFNEPLVGSTARNRENYSVRPHGTVERVQAEGSTPTTVTVRIDGIIAGASGQEASLKVSSLRSVNGKTLVEEGATVRLTQPADNLANVKVYPNPLKLSRHDPKLTVAGIPTTATIRIYSPAGRLVEELSVEGNRRGGTTWDLRTQRGSMVPSGIYLVRVEAPESSPVIKKAAVIR
jgi:subtilisin family serine protease